MMTTPEPEQLLAALPPPADPDAVRTELRHLRARNGRRVAVLDDDPTGTQTVHGVPVITAWTDDDLTWGLSGSAAVYVSTNSRSLPAGDAAEISRTIGQRLRAASRTIGHPVSVVSRSDSTLRGHYPAEVTALAGEWQAEGGVDAVILAFAYPEAGRLTIGGTHWLATGDHFLPVGESEFARDATFGYAASFLPDWVAEKTAGTTRADDVSLITLADIRGGGPDAVMAALERARGAVVAVDAADVADLAVLALAASRLEDQGYRFIYRSGPSFAQALAGISPRPPVTAADLYPQGAQARHGLVVAGSHTALTTAQIGQAMAAHPGLTYTEADVAALLADPDAEMARLVPLVTAALSRGSVVLATTRTAQLGGTAAESLNLSRSVSSRLAELTKRIIGAAPPRFLVAKGGITSADLAVHACGIRRATVTGSLFPGIVAAWQPAQPELAAMPFVVFAGNVGHDRTLAEALTVLMQDPPAIRPTAGQRNPPTDKPGALPFTGTDRKGNA